MPGVTELVDAAIDRGETFESAGAGKASMKDLTYYVMEIHEETSQDKIDQVWNGYSDSVVAAALFRIWTGEGQ